MSKERSIRHDHNSEEGKKEVKKKRRPIHVTSPLSAQEIRDVLKISDKDMAAARRAIEATLPKKKQKKKTR